MPSRSSSGNEDHLSGRPLSVFFTRFVRGFDFFTFESSFWRRDIIAVGAFVSEASSLVLSETRLYTLLN